MIDKAGIAGMEACEDKAERETDFSTDAAKDAILEELGRGPATGEMLVWRCKERGIVPHDDRAFGSAFKSLSGQGLIYKVGYGPRHRGHGTAGAIVWALA